MAKRSRRQDVTYKKTDRSFQPRCYEDRRVGVEEEGKLNRKAHEFRSFKVVRRT